MGGMFYGSGYYSIKNEYSTISNTSTCLGGRISLFVTPKLLIGGLGNAITVNYEPSSYYRIGSGGIAVEYLFTKAPFFISAGGMIGGGKMKNLHVTSRQDNLYLVDFQNTSFLFVAPIVTFSYQLTSKIGATLIVDVPFTNQQKWIKNAVNVRGGLVFFR